MHHHEVFGKGSTVRGHCGLDEDQSATEAQRIVDELRREGLRRTPALVSLLEELCRHHHPVTLAALRENAGLRDRDQATVYRLVCKLEEHGMVRRLGLRGRASHFLLALPEHHHDYLVCTGCGVVEAVEVSCPVEKMEIVLCRESGWSGLRHELEFFGLCPVCQC